MISWAFSFHLIKREISVIDFHHGQEKHNHYFTLWSSIFVMPSRLDEGDSGGTLFPRRLEGNIRTFAEKSLQSVVCLLIDVDMV